MARAGRLGLLTLLLLLGGLVIWYARMLDIGRVECFTQFGPCPDDLALRAQFLLGRPIYRPLPRRQIASVYAGLPQVSEVAVSRRLPRTIVVAVTLRHPLAVVLGASRELVVIDDQGVIFDSVGKSALPVIVLDGNVSVGDKLSALQLLAAKLLSRVAGVVQLPVRGRLQSELLVVTVQNGVEIVLDVNRTGKDWDTSLQAIWGRSKIDGKFMRKIDLRFNPVGVSY